MAKDENNPIGWMARAWNGRCYQELADPAHARSEYEKIMDADVRAKDAKRLARYFRLLTIREVHEKGEDGAYIIRQAKDWIADYSGYLKTPEGYGLRYLLAKVYYDETNENPKLQASDKATYLKDARNLLRQVELSENDFTDQARQLKIQVIYKQQNGFNEPVAKLKDFEDCYVRAQFEQMELLKDERTIKNPDDLEKKKKERLATITAALEKGLKLAKPGESPLEVGNAKAMLAFQYLNAKKYAEAIALAEPFAHGDPRSAQAAAASVYALQSYAEMISRQEQAGATPEELKTLHDKLIALASFMEKNWPKEQAGDMARNQLALLYINEKDPDKRDDNVQQAILALSRITPTYSNYTVTQYQLAQFALDAEKEKIKPIANDPPDGYRKRALAALEKLPPLTPGADPMTNKFYFLAKVRLGQELSALKRYADMEKLSEAVLPTLAGVPLDADNAKGEELRGQIADSLKSFKLYAHWAEADAEAKAADKADAAGKTAHYTKVMELLDPIVDEVIAKQHPELKNNPALARGILDNDLRASIQLSKLDRTRSHPQRLQGTDHGQRGRRRRGGSVEAACGVYSAAIGRIEAQDRRGGAEEPGQRQGEVRRDPGGHDQTAGGRQANAETDLFHLANLFEHGQPQGGGRPVGEGDGAGQGRALRATSTFTRRSACCWCASGGWAARRRKREK